MFIGGEAAPGDHVWVCADIRAERTREQKAAILPGGEEAWLASLPSKLPEKLIAAS